MAVVRYIHTMIRIIRKILKRFKIMNVIENGTLLLDEKEILYS